MMKASEQKKAAKAFAEYWKVDILPMPKGRGFSDRS